LAAAIRAPPATRKFWWLPATKLSVISAAESAK
jgi:hypothetical protein